MHTPLEVPGNSWVFLRRDGEPWDGFSAEKPHGVTYGVFFN